MRRWLTWWLVGCLGCSVAMAQNGALSQLGARGTTMTPATNEVNGTNVYYKYLVLLGTNGMLASGFNEPTSNTVQTILTGTYIDARNGGDNTNVYNGTITRPFKTLTNAVVQYPTNVLFVLMPGAYASPTIVNPATTNLTLVGLDPDHTVLTGQLQINNDVGFTINAYGLQLNEVKQMAYRYLIAGLYNRASANDQIWRQYPTSVNSPLTLSRDASARTAYNIVTNNATEILTTLSTNVGYAADLNVTSIWATVYGIVPANVQRALDLLGSSAVPHGTAPGQVMYWNGTNWSLVAAGTTNQILYGGVHPVFGNYMITFGTNNLAADFVPYTNNVYGIGRTNLQWAAGWFSNVYADTLSRLTGLAFINCDTGELCTAEGIGTVATGPGSHSEGESSTAQGADSHAEGYATAALGDYAHAEGESSRAEGQADHAEGDSIANSGVAGYAHAENTSFAYGERSHSEGAGSIANGYGSHAEGDTTIADGRAAHAEGAFAHAHGDESHAEGYGTVGSNAYDHAEGQYSIADGGTAHAEGGTTHANGAASHSEGYQAVASNTAAHAEGLYTIASGLASHAEGAYTLADGMYSHAAGYGGYATDKNTYTWSDGVPYGDHGSNTYNVHADKGIYLDGETATRRLTLMATNSYSITNWLQVGDLGAAGSLGVFAGQTFSLTNTLFVVGSNNIAGNASVYSTKDGTNWVDQRAVGPAGVQRQYAGTCIHNGRVYLAGGVTAGVVYHNDVWWSDDGLTWNQAAVNTPFPARKEIGLLSFQGNLFMLGGFDGINPCDNVYKSIDNGTNWTLVSAASIGTWATHNVFTTDGTYMYEMGGGVGPFSQASRSLNGATWQNLGYILTTRTYGAAVVQNGVILLFGGSVANSMQYSTDQGVSWNTYVVPINSLHPGVAFVGNRLFVVGVNNGSSDVLVLADYDTWFQQGSVGPSLGYARVDTTTVVRASDPLLVPKLYLSPYDKTSYITAVTNPAGICTSIVIRVNGVDVGYFANP